MFLNFFSQILVKFKILTILFYLDKTKCEPIFCKFPSLNQCQQICKHNSNETGYDCSCEPEFYELDEEGYECRPKVDLNKTCNCTGGSFCGLHENDCKCRVGYVLKLEEGVNKCKPDCKSIRYFI
jgi:hypothetical protein